MDTGTEEKRTRFVVVGGGFGGVYAALHLAQYDPEGYEIEVILVSDRNHFTFTPLLHDVLGGSLSGHHVAVPYRVLGERVGFRFVQARMEGLDRDRGAIETTVGPIDYDYLILALGARPAARVRGPRPAELGEDSVGPVVTPFHRIPDAVWMHDRVLDLAERCVRTDDEAERRRLLTFVVGGGGPAGVEAAGELLQLLHSVLPRYYDCLEGARVVLVHGDERILRGWDADLARRGQETLREAGLELHLETRLGEVTDQGVRISPEGGGEEQEIEAMTVIDATGNIPNSGCLEDSGLPLDDQGRIRVDEHLRVEGEARIFAVGDVNDLCHPRSGEPYPDVAPIALSQGVRAAANALSERGGWSMEPYGGDHAGKIMSLGGQRALVELLGFSFGGRGAWLINRAAYLLKLVGTRNKAQAATTLLLNRIFVRNLLAGEEVG